MKCHHFETNQCISCPHIRLPMVQQLEAKSQKLATLLQDYAVANWSPPVSGKDQGFRNKAKMVVLGAAHQPILGILSPSGVPVSLCDCVLYPLDMQLLLQRLQKFVQQAGIPPYQLNKSKGELKYILLSRSEIQGEFLLRFVLRSTQAIERIQRVLPQLLQAFPKIKVVSVNIQPIHMAILEGDQEIFLTENTRLEERFNDVPLYIRSKSFFQTNPQVAAKLYQTAREWVEERVNESNEGQVKSIWDLFCGVGGFGLHCSSENTQLTGIEIEAEAIACAELSATKMGLKSVLFKTFDSADFALSYVQQKSPDVVIVNPPRRGLGRDLVQLLLTLAPETILYSSCNPDSAALDLQTLCAQYQIAKVQLFDMFPHTDHFEVLMLLVKSH
ncbi:MAG: 23S rRNA (uracil(747)-C(5))-methyltransferase RlmC [Gammaproteobacteria bacterium CG22_combo_CG10-13_8_21_14_all_40_8]|nr:MAG: 23S rRNA (uracil(747)-C(5))-methyltransferase RlmC [Gammaproteobacteria bacterium CG22_combo_CG10-13_8_21_14_all_40_8]